MEIGKTLVLTTKNCVERNNYINSLENLGSYEFFYGYNKKKDLLNFLEKSNKKFLYNPTLKSGIIYRGQIGCYIGHYSIIKKIVDEKLENTIILENDITIDKKDWREYLKNVMIELPKDYDILLLYSRSKNLQKFKKFRIKNKKLISNYNKTSGAVAYMISLKGAIRLKKLLDDNILKPFDLFIKELAKEKKVFNLNTYMFKVNLEFDSTIKTNKITNDIGDYYNYNFFKFIEIDETYNKSALIITPDILDLNDQVIILNLKEELLKHKIKVRTMKAKHFNHKRINHLELVIVFSSVLWPYRRKKIPSTVRKIGNCKTIVLNTECFLNSRFYKKVYERIVNTDFVLDLFLINLKFYKEKNNNYLKFNFENINKFEKNFNKTIDFLIINDKHKLDDSKFDKYNIKVVDENINLEELNILLADSKIVIYNNKNMSKFSLLDYFIYNKVLFLTNLKYYKFLESFSNDNLIQLSEKYLNLTSNEVDNIINKNYEILKKLINESSFNFKDLNKYFINDKNKSKRIDYLLLDFKEYKNDLLLDLNNNPVQINLNGKSIIVGSSGKMLLKDFGDEIDKYENIIRINFSPTEKYEKNVGSKTTIRFIRNNALRKLNKEIDIFLNDADITIFIGESRINKIVKKLDKNKIHLKINSKYTDFFNSFFNRSLSSGFYTVLISDLFSEQKIDLTGFMNLGEINGKCMYHYWEHLNGRQKSYIGKNTNHDFLDESKIINNLTNVLF